MDYVLVYHGSKNKHLEHLKLIFQMIREAAFRMYILQERTHNLR